jgi:hypothetical protein
MKTQVIHTPNNKLIEVYDDAFTYHERYKFYNYVKNSAFGIMGSDGSSGIQYDQIQQIYSSFSYKDIDQMGMSKTDIFQTLAKKYNFVNREVKQMRINVSPPAERNFVHSDAEGLTFLYYINLEWKLEWGGHTLFMDDNLEDAIYTSVYKPGRLVIFNGTIPHMIMTPTMSSAQYRYSLAIQFREEQ